jgi:hypothetical protein
MQDLGTLGGTESGSYDINQHAPTCCSSKDSDESFFTGYKDRLLAQAKVFRAAEPFPFN